MSLATVADVEAILQIDITDDDDPKVEALLAMASELIDAELGRPAEGGTPRVETIPVPLGSARPTLLLDRWPVEAVASVVEDGDTLTADTAYRVDLEAGALYRLDTAAHDWYWTPLAVAVVTYTPQTVPGTRAICAQAVARTFRAGAAYANRPSILAGFRQLTIGRWSGTAETETGATATSPLSLTETERATLRGWRDRRP